MMFPEFLRFYGYTAEEALNEYAKRFFSLVNMMLRIQAKEMLNAVTVTNTGTNGGKDGEKVIDELRKQSKGNQGILNEVRNIRK